MPTSNNPKSGDGCLKEAQQSRRSWLWGGVVASLTATYGTITAYALGFIFPSRQPSRPQRIFIGFSHEIGVGESKSLTLPSGDQLIVSNTGSINPDTGTPFLGFSNRCPHLGCRVHWDNKGHRFFCPCHQGVFDPAGVAVSGPPAAAGQKLKPYAIEVDGASLYAVVEDA